MKSSQKNAWVVVPVYNEGKSVAQVIRGIHETGHHNIIVVNDGSTDATKEFISRNDCVYLEHKINRGKGAAIRTGVEAALLHGADIVVTMDGDGQHSPRDLPQMLQPLLLEKADVVLGTRAHHAKHMPRHRIIGNVLANAFTWLLSGLHVGDSQSGFRAYSRKALGAIRSAADDYAFESEVIREIRRRRLNYVEIPIQTIYTKHSRAKGHGQGLGTGLLTLIRIVWKSIT